MFILIKHTKTIITLYYFGGYSNITHIYSINAANGHLALVKIKNKILSSYHTDITLVLYRQFNEYMVNISGLDGEMLCSASSKPF